MRGRGAVCGAALLIGAAAAAAAQEPPGPRVTRVRIERVSVFDPAVPGEDLWPFRLANRIHVKTAESVVALENLIAPNERWDPLHAIETERNLRSLGFIRHASVSKVDLPGGEAEMVIRTQDSWTLSPQFSAGTEGGESFLLYGVDEGNLLGLGKSISLFQARVGSSFRSELRYHDPRLLQSRYGLTTQFSSTFLGNEAAVHLERPFRALEDPNSVDLSWSKIIQEETLYQDARQTTQFLQNYRSVKSLFGRRISRGGPLVQRASLGTLYERQRFNATADTAAGTLPADRTLSGPLAGYSWIQPRYIKEVNVDRMQTVEDFNLGNELTLLGGPMLESFGSDRDRIHFTVLDQQGLSLGPGRAVLAQVGSRGRVADGALENAIFFANLNFFWKSGRWPWQTLVGHMEYNTTRRLDAEKQLILGGDTGLRGYRNKSFTGGRSFLLNIEDRLFWDKELFHLIYLGGVAFFDTGAIAPPAESLSVRQLKSDAGIGLRLSSSRSTSGGVLRIDAAYRLNDGPDGSRWVLTVLGGQAFSLTGSTNRRALRRPDAVLEDSSVTSRLRRR